MEMPAVCLCHRKIPFMENGTSRWQIWLSSYSIPDDTSLPDIGTPSKLASHLTGNYGCFVV
jgi:hypothetical protein